MSLRRTFKVVTNLPSDRAGNWGEGAVVGQGRRPQSRASKGSRLPGAPPVGAPGSSWHADCLMREQPDPIRLFHLEYSMSWTAATAPRQTHAVSDSAGLFACYEAIAGLSEDMVDAAERGDWDEVSLLERECASQMERLGRGQRSALSREELQRKRDLMMRILANDARVRALVCPRQDELMRLVHGTRRSIGARQAYAAVSYY